MFLEAFHIWLEAFYYFVKRRFTICLKAFHYLFGGVSRDWTMCLCGADTDDYDYHNDDDDADDDQDDDDDDDDYGNDDDSRTLKKRGKPLQVPRKKR